MFTGTLPAYGSGSLPVIESALLAFTKDAAVSVSFTGSVFHAFTSGVSNLDVTTVLTVYRVVQSVRTAVYTTAADVAPIVTLGTGVSVPLVTTAALVLTAGSYVFSVSIAETDSDVNVGVSVQPRGQLSVTSVPLNVLAPCDLDTLE